MLVRAMCDFFPPGIMSAHGLLSSVFSCSQGSKSVFKRRLRQTRSLDPAMMMRPCGSEGDEPTRKVRRSFVVYTRVR